ncbi:3-isopropylmalate dehydrogenase [uncultured Phycicoccus sp.]|nr:3-isopropylmalate dehydrogenase [uncultured Phycicoccus sp.]
MNETTTMDAATMARQALQESMDLRDQGHTDD